MRKAIVSFVLLSGMVFSGVPCTYAAAAEAYRTSSAIQINDYNCAIAGYNINNNNYFRLRDLAYYLRDTSAKFDIVWNEGYNSIELTTGSAYTENGEDVKTYYRTIAQPTASQLIIDGREVYAEAYNIDGNNYYKLRDLGEYIPFEVQWLEYINSVCIYALDDNAVMSESSENEIRRMTAAVSKANKANVIKSYIYTDDGDSVNVVDVYDGAINVDTYDAGRFRYTGNKTIPLELEKFGGFYAGEKYNYFVFGQDNTEENDRKEVIRIVRYDKQFRRIDHASVSACYTIAPFEAGTLRMAERGNELTIHTGRKRYTTRDGLNHQSQLTIILDTNSMTVKNDLGEFQGNHVSHSFNQFVKYDGSNTVFVDHGDAYPRSVALTKLSGGTYTQADLFKIPGETGINSTGVTVGGLEVADRHYIIAINTIEHGKVSTYEHFKMIGLDVDERNVVLLISEKNNPDKVRQVRLTDYINNGKLASTPYLVKMGSDRYMVLWEEFEYADDGQIADNGVRYVVVDEDGIADTRVIAETGMWLSADCQPIFLDGNVLWYVNTNAGRVFFRI